MRAINSIQKIAMDIITELIILAYNVSVTVDVPKTSIIMGKKHYKSHHLYFIKGASQLWHEEQTTHLRLS
jgi:hypothetical protein